VTDYGTISEQLQHEPESLRRSIISSMAKLKGLDLLTGSNAFQRDQSLLNERQRAYYRQMGLDVEDEESITNILADNITITGKEPQASQEPVKPDPEPEQKPDPKPPSQPPVQEANRWLPWLLAAGLAIANLGAGYWIVNSLPEGSQPRTTIGLETK